MKDEFKVGDKVKIPKRNTARNAMTTIKEFEHEMSDYKLDYLIIYQVWSDSDPADSEIAVKRADGLHLKLDLFDKSDLELYVEKDEFVLPEKWMVKVTKANKSFIEQWRTDGHIYGVGGWCLSKHHNCQGYYIFIPPPGYTEITFEQFEKYVLKKDLIPSNSGELKPEAVNHPSHYNKGKIEVIDFIEDQELGFNLGNALKYICRAGVKDKAKEKEDLEKAIWYIKRKLSQLKNA